MILQVTGEAAVAQGTVRLHFGCLPVAILSCSMLRDAA